MAKEYTGVLFCLMLAIRSDLGKKMLGKRAYFKKKGHIDNWIMLLGTLLEWEEWLKQPQLRAKLVVDRLKKKHQYIMQLVKFISRRTTGMGLKITKFHAILHMVEDIVAFGIPRGFDTGPRESHHKPGKMAARLTQKKKSRFEEQTHNRLEEVELLALAEEEREGRVPWNYYQGYEFPPEQEPMERAPRTFGKAYRTRINPSGEPVLITDKKVRGYNRRITVEQPFVDFFHGLRELVAEHIPNLKLRTTHEREGTIFRAHLDFHGSSWRDWVVVDWDTYGKLPNKIWGFVDLSQLPSGRNGLEYGGLAHLQPSVYAIVETAHEFIPAQEFDIPLIEEFTTEVGAMAQGFVTEHKYYLADVEAFDEATIVVPNIGGKTNSYFQVEPRDRWVREFELFLAQRHSNKEIPQDDVEESDEDQRSVASVGDELVDSSDDEEVGEDDSEDTEEDDSDDD